MNQHIKIIRSELTSLHTIVGDLSEALAALDALEQAMKEPVAWVHESDPDRVISAATKVGAVRDGGAISSSTKFYSVPAFAAPPAQQGYTAGDMASAAAQGFRDGQAAQQAQPTDTRTCTCHPDDNPPTPCAKKYALTECKQAQAECDAIAELNHAQWLALENVRTLANRNRKEEWAQHLLRFVEEAGTNKAQIMRRQVEQAQAEAVPRAVFDGVVPTAIRGYLRRCSSGGMPKKHIDIVQANVDEAERLGYFKLAIAEAVLASRKASATKQAEVVPQRVACWCFDEVSKRLCADKNRCGQVIAAAQGEKP